MEIKNRIFEYFQKVFGIKKIFRIYDTHNPISWTNNPKHFRYRVDQKHYLFFGLISWYDKGASSLSNYMFRDLSDCIKVVKSQKGEFDKNWIKNRKYPN